jgi:hypothetical protein
MKKYDTKRFFAILNELNRRGARIDRHEEIRKLTDGRTESLTELQPNEFNHLVSSLQIMLNEVKGSKEQSWQPSNSPVERKRKKLLSVFHELAAKVPNQYGSCAKGKANVDEIMRHINAYGKHKAMRFNDFNEKQLNELITQFETILRKYYERSRTNG